MFTFYLLYNKSFNLCGRKSPEIPFHTRRSIIKLSQAGNSQRKRVKDLSISHTIVQSIIKKFKNTGFVWNMGLRSRKPRRTILETNLLLRLTKSKRKRTFAQSLTIPEPRNFLRLELEITGEEMGLKKGYLRRIILLDLLIERHEWFFVKRIEIGQKKTGKVVFFRWDSGLY